MPPFGRPALRAFVVEEEKQLLVAGWRDLRNQQGAAQVSAKLIKPQFALAHALRCC